MTAQQHAPAGAMLDTPPAFATRFGAEVTRGRHRLRDSGLFEDDALAALIDRHPRDLSDYYLSDVDGNGADALKVVFPDGMTGAQLVAAAREGSLWVNLRRVTNTHAEYGALLERAFADLRRSAPRFRPLRHTGGLLISSPSARVPYHFDKTDVTLWHIRGVKELRVYPVRAPYVRDEDVETQLLDITREELPYAPDFDAAAEVCRLEPGDMIAWPLHSPHRVENVSGLNVSLTVEYSSWRSSRANGVYYANAVLRRRFGMSPPPAAGARAPEQAVKFLLARAFRASGLGRAAAEPYSLERARLDPATADRPAA